MKFQTNKKNIKVQIMILNRYGASISYINNTTKNKYVKFNIKYKKYAFNYKRIDYF